MLFKSDYETYLVIGSIYSWKFDNVLFYSIYNLQDRSIERLLRGYLIYFFNPDLLRHGDKSLVALVCIFVFYIWKINAVCCFCFYLLLKRVYSWDFTTVNIWLNGKIEFK